MFLTLFEGHYLYIETSRGKSGRKDGDIARLDSPILPSTDGYCLSFWYHMYGPHVGKLRVRQLWNLKSKVHWVRKGTQGELYIHLIRYLGF